MHVLLNIWFSWVREGGYLGIIFLMAMESSIFPVPSEIVIPPAAFWAAQGKMSFWLVVASGVLGSWLGASITYWLARWLGRPLLLKYGHYVLLGENKLLLSERWLERYETSGVFFARLLPVVRHLISIPAGIIRMNFGIFSLMTLIGSSVWCLFLAWFGQKIIGSHPQLMDNPEQLMYFVKDQSLWLVALVLVLAICYFLVLKIRI